MTQIAYERIIRRRAAGLNDITGTPMNDAAHPSKPGYAYLDAIAARIAHNEAERPFDARTDDRFGFYVVGAMRYIVAGILGACLALAFVAHSKRAETYSLQYVDSAALNSTR